MVDELTVEFNIAADAYNKAVYSGATISHVERLQYASQFRSFVEVFKYGGSSAQTVLDSELRSAEHDRHSVAVRLLIECGNQASLDYLSRNFMQFQFHFDNRALKRLWVAFPPPQSLFDELVKTEADGFTALVDALLYRPTDNVYELFGKLHHNGNSWMVNHALQRVDRWGDSSLIDDLISSFLNEESNEFEIRAEAAFYAVINGNNNGPLQFLKDAANSKELDQAIQACRHLSQLALPDAIQPLLKLIKSNDGDIVERARNDIADLGLPLFVPSLCSIAQSKQSSKMYDGETPLYDEAIRTLTVIIGHSLNELEEHYLETLAYELEFTEEYRNEAIQVAQKALQSMNPMRRYHFGELLTLKHLASDLLSPHHGPIQKAAHNLRAITGEDYGFDPDDDVIANLSAIETWQRRAERPEPLTPGGWAFMGRPLPDPEMPSFT